MTAGTIAYRMVWNRRAALGPAFAARPDLIMVVDDEPTFRRSVGTDLAQRLEEHGLFNTVLMSGRDVPDLPRFLRKPFHEDELLSLVRRELVGASA